MSFDDDDFEDSLDGLDPADLDWQDERNFRALDVAKDERAEVLTPIVVRARRGGESWEAIAAILGLSVDEAQEQYPLADHQPQRPPLSDLISDLRRRAAAKASSRPEA